MKPNPRFQGQTKQFWAYVRLISELTGYYRQPGLAVAAPISIEEIVRALQYVTVRLGLRSAPDLSNYPNLSFDAATGTLSHRGPVGPAEAAALIGADPKRRKGWSKAIEVLAKRSSHLAWASVTDLLDHGRPTALGQGICAYLCYRDQSLAAISAQLMTAEEAAQLYEETHDRTKSRLQPVMNKQSDEKAVPAYLTAIVAMILAEHAGDLPLDSNPQRLVKIVTEDKLQRVLARRMDGAFPSTVNPIAVWEIKEYYFTTSFGSRIADGVYESLLDAMELEEVRATLGLPIDHVVIVDAKETWWSSGGRPYLCRLLDMLHMHHVEEVIFGREVLTALPRLIQKWARLLKP